MGILDIPSLSPAQSDSRYPQSDDIRHIVQLTQSAYDALSSPSADTLYIIVG